MVLPPRPRTQLNMWGSMCTDSSTNSTSPLARSMLSGVFPKIRTVLMSSLPSPSTIRMLTSYFSCNDRIVSPPLPMMRGTKAGSTCNSIECLYPTPSMRLRLDSSALSRFSRVSWKLWICAWCLTCTSSSIFARVMALASPTSLRLPFSTWMQISPDWSSMWLKHPNASGVETQASKPLGSLWTSDFSAPPAKVLQAASGRIISLSTMASLLASAPAWRGRATKKKPCLMFRTTATAQPAGACSVGFTRISISSPTRGLNFSSSASLCFGGFRTRDAGYSA
mmetsp:Transcript_57861/g.185830  ORF Transcript_57861/g.185830 Transcript_57861/m.185830 type:complete len:281 (+) Transcript_57861:507-1349(+)